MCWNTTLESKALLVICVVCKQLCRISKNDKIFELPFVYTKHKITEFYRWVFICWKCAYWRLIWDIIWIHLVNVPYYSLLITGESFFSSVLDVVIMYITWPRCRLSRQRSCTHLNIFFSTSYYLQCVLSTWLIHLTVFDCFECRRHF